ncbi:MAG: inositol monophosphatase family protein [Myxococcota bacterium]|nr:inositol monophosphatase family protein [Myxococcota bacterium]
MTEREHKALLAIAIEAAAAGSACLRAHYGRLKNIRSKGAAGDLVTEADLAAEAAVLEVLKRRTPEIPVLAEESGGAEVAEHGLLWCIDPLDGTTNFAHGYPIFATSVGLLDGQRPLLGCVDLPFLGEVFEGGAGLGARCNGEPIQVSETGALSESLLVTGFGYDRRTVVDNNYAEFCALTDQTHGVRRGGAAAVDIVYTACGRLDGYWERALSPWDIAAGIAILEAAGGEVSDYDRAPFSIREGRLLATNTRIHDALSAALCACAPLDPVTYRRPAE